MTIVVTPVSSLEGSTTPIHRLTTGRRRLVGHDWLGLAGQYTVTETTQPVGYLDGKVTPGSLGGTVAAIGDQITISLLGGQAGVEYDFGKRLPASLAGNVSDCLTGTALSGVTVQLLDSQGNVLQTTTTNAQGNYQFAGLTPGSTYGVSEILPTGYIHNDEDAGSVGGVVAANASIMQIAAGRRHDCHGLQLLRRAAGQHRWQRQRLPRRHAALGRHRAIARRERQHFVDDHDRRAKAATSSTT